jgi:NAD(P)-dependent dehydrogenase (short-subunit alcohol dehydrogenase family)
MQLRRRRHRHGRESAGIGRETALEFARQARASCWRPGARPAQALADEIRGTGGEALAVPTDVARSDDIERLVQAALDRFGRIDVLVNNAGFGFSGTIEETTEADMRELMDVNYMSAFNATRAVLPHMRRQRRGHIVNVASVVGKIAFPFHGAYSATKFAMIGMTEALRGELYGSGITATAVLLARRARSSSRRSARTTATCRRRRARSRMRTSWRARSCGRCGSRRPR